MTMETIFTASNGTTISTEKDQLDDQVRWHLADKVDRYSAVFLRDTEVSALREYFQAEEDKRLGRWRWPDNPDFVVYPGRPDGVVRVFRESTCQMLRYLRGEYIGSAASEFGRPARAYFDAHPEPKPWHDAKPGEVWALTVNVFDPRGVEDAFITERRDNQMVFVPLRQGYAVSYIGVKATGITAGHRIWPEVES